MPNYKNEVLINLVEAVLPTGAMMWVIVADRYQVASGEVSVREGQDIKRHFTTPRQQIV